MSNFLEDMKKDWDELKEKVHDDIEKDNRTVDQAFDYQTSGNPDEILSQEPYAQQQASKVINAAMDEYRASLKDANTDDSSNSESK